MSEQIARNDFRQLVNTSEWRSFIEYLFNDFLKAQEAIICKFATKQDGYEFKEALMAKQSIEWFMEWIELFRNGGGGIVQYDSDNYNGGEK